MTSYDPNKYVAERVEPLIAELIAFEDEVAHRWRLIEEEKLSPSAEAEQSPPVSGEAIAVGLCGALVFGTGGYAVAAVLTYLVSLLVGDVLGSWPSWIAAVGTAGYGFDFSFHDAHPGWPEKPKQRPPSPHETKLFIAFGRSQIVLTQLRQYGVAAATALEAIKAWRAAHPDQPVASSHLPDGRPTPDAYRKTADLEREREAGLVARYRDLVAEHSLLAARRRTVIERHGYCEEDDIKDLDARLGPVREELFKLKVMLNHLGVSPDEPTPAPASADPPAPKTPEHRPSPEPLPKVPKIVAETRRLKNEEDAFARAFASDPELVARARTFYRRRQEEFFDEPELDYGA